MPAKLQTKKYNFRYKCFYTYPVHSTMVDDMGDVHFVNKRIKCMRSVILSFSGPGEVGLSLSRRLHSLTNLQCSPTRCLQTYKCGGCSLLQTALSSLPSVNNSVQWVFTGCPKRRRRSIKQGRIRKAIGHVMVLCKHVCTRQHQHVHCEWSEIIWIVILV